MLKGFPVFDVDQVEVLRGPQGTLFGRNSPAGVIKFDSAKPVFKTEGYLSAGFGKDRVRNLDGAYNIPVSDTVAIRFAGSSQHRGDRVSNEQTLYCPLGKTLPDYSLGLSSTVSWGGLSLYGLLDAVQGFDVFNFDRRLLEMRPGAPPRASATAGLCPFPPPTPPKLPLKISPTRCRTTWTRTCARRSRTASTACGISSSRTATTAPASGPLTQASAPATDSPVTCHTCGASPQPVTPSVSVTATRRLSVVVVRRSAVTKGVCRGTLTRWHVTRSTLLIPHAPATSSS